MVTKPKTPPPTDAGLFAVSTHRETELLEDGTDDSDFKPRTVRVSAVYTRQDVALLVFQVSRIHTVLERIRALLGLILLFALVAYLFPYLFQKG